MPPDGELGHRSNAGAPAGDTAQTVSAAAGGGRDHHIVDPNATAAATYRADRGGERPSAILNFDTL